MANKKVSQLTSKPSVLTTDLFPIADPSTGQLFKTTISDLGTAIGSGVSSVNSLVGAVVLDTDDIQELVSPTNKWFTDTRARAALSASSPLTYNSGTGAFGIQVANGSQNGYLSSADWTTFNSKQAALSGTGFVKISGTTISYDNSTYALDSAVVKLTGDQTIAGIKTFSSNVNGSQFTVGTPFDISRAFAAAGNQHSIALWLEEYTSTGGGAPDIFFNNGRGTISSKANIQVGDGLGGITWSGYVNGNFNSTAGFGAIVVNIDSTNNQANADITIDQSYNSATATNNFRLYANGGGLYIRGNVQGASFVKAGGTSSQFLKADGSVDSNTYLTTGTAASTYLPLSGGTLTGALSGTSATFSGTVTLSNSELVGGSTLKLAATNSTIYLRPKGANDSTNQISIDNTGAATFSSSVTCGAISSAGVSGFSRSGLTFTLNPSYAAGDVYTQLQSTGALALASGGDNNRLYIDSYGNIGINTTTISSILDIRQTNLPRITLVKTSTISWYIGNPAQSTSNQFSIGTDSGSNTNILTLDNGGHVLITKTSLSASSVGVEFEKNSTTRMTVDGGTVLLLNRLTSDGTIADFRRSTTQVGSISVTTVMTSYNVTSDYRLKEDLKPINGLDIVNKIKVYDYKWKADNSRMDGVLAHELQEVLPYAVIGIKDGEQMQQVDYSKIVPVMVQAIKDLKAELDTLKNK